MRLISVPVGQNPHDFATAPRQLVPAHFASGGLVVTPSVTRPARFVITHTKTGCAVPTLTNLSLDAAIAICRLLGAAFPWEVVDDIFFVRSMPANHRDALSGCIVALREMFEAA